MKSGGQERPSKLKRAVVVAVVLLACAAAAWTLHERQEIVSSTDATLDAETVHIGSTVGGRIVDIAVRDNSQVRANDLLFQIDPVPLQLAVNQAEADLAVARASLATQRRGVNTQRSAATQAADQIRKGEANHALAQRNVQRLAPLAAKGYVPQVELDQAQTSERDTRTSLQQAREQARASVQAIDTDDSGLANVRAREAALARARHALANATVVAPHDGYVVGLKVASGEIVAPSQPLFTLVRSKEWTAIANIRESDLAGVQVGDCATVYSMIDRRRPLHGKVQGIGAGVAESGSVNAPRQLPFVERSVNWVRVAQRFPVRIELEDQPPELMRVGASAIVEIQRGRSCH